MASILFYFIFASSMLDCVRNDHVSSSLWSPPVARPIVTLPCRAHVFWLVVVRLNAFSRPFEAAPYFFFYYILSINSTAEPTPRRHPTRSTPGRISSPSLPHRLSLTACWLLCSSAKWPSKEMVRPYLYFFVVQFDGRTDEWTPPPTRSARPHLLPDAPPTANAIVHLIVVYSKWTAAIKIEAPPLSLIFSSLNLSAAPTSERHPPHAPPVRISSPTHPPLPTPLNNWLLCI
jgi:hypothetical protein